MDESNLIADQKHHVAAIQTLEQTIAAAPAKKQTIMQKYLEETAMQITAELDSQHLEKLHELERTMHKGTSELIALAIDKIYETQLRPTEGERVLAVLRETGFIGSLPDIEDLSENYKDYLDWSDKT